MSHSLFDVLRDEGLTTLRIRHDWRSGRVALGAAREWDDDLDWSSYQALFTTDDALTNHARYLVDDEVRSVFRRGGASELLDGVIELIRKGRHVGIDGYYWRRKDLRFINNRHSIGRGLNNRSHALMAGGIRRHERGDAEYDVILDGLNLARAMSFKNVAAEIPFGGCKTTVHSDPVDLNDLHEIGFLSYALDRTRCFTGPDMGYPPELADVMRRHFTINITGGPHGPLGPTGTPTANGVFLAVKEAARFALGSADLRNRTIAVQGIGAVGLPLADHFLQEGARLIVSDPNDAPIRLLKSKHPAGQIEVVNGDEIYLVEADIFSPCAVGGIITRERIPCLKSAVILGGANNELAATSQEEEYALARALAERGILFQCDWWHNIAGVMAGYEEYEHQRDASATRLAARIADICPRKTRDNLEAARKSGITPTESAYRTVEAAIYGPPLQNGEPPLRAGATPMTTEVV